MTPERGLDARVDVLLGAFRLTAALVAAPGEVVAVTGPNGAGKTTLLRALAGALPGASPPSGRRLGYVPSGALLLPHLSARDNVALVVRASGVHTAQARRRATAALTAVGSLAYGDVRGSALSAGQAQRVALARALVGDPRLLLLDEPFAAVAEADRAALRALVRTALGSGPDAGCVVIATHDRADVDWADRVVALADGQLAPVTG